MSAAAAKTAKGFTSLQELFIDEFTLFKQESLKLKCFRLINLYGVFSSLVSAILDIQLPITLSLDIYSLVGSLIALKMTRDWRLQEVPQKKRVLRFRLNAFGLLFHSIGIILAAYSYNETKSSLVLLVFMYHIIMSAFAILLMLYNIGQILYFKMFENGNVVEQSVVKSEIIIQANDIELSQKELVVDEVNNALNETVIEETDTTKEGDSTCITTEEEDSAIALPNIKDEENNDC
jgi:hypothetical protein